MTLFLVVQCISFWDFAPVEEAVELRIDGTRYPYTAKKGGYYAITKPLPDTFTLTVRSRSHCEAVQTVTEVPADKVVSVQMIPADCRAPNAAWLCLRDSCKAISVALGYGYRRVAALDAGWVEVKNPEKENLEGRRFLLRDTAAGQEEFVTLGAALDMRFRRYRMPPPREAYASPEKTVLLPAAGLSASGTAPWKGERRIPFNLPLGVTCPVWIYCPKILRAEITGGESTLVELAAAEQSGPKTGGGSRAGEG